MRVLGIIPARGGSKGVPRKNVRLVAGQPLISYTIEAAKRSRTLSHFVTSTDDREIAAAAEMAGSPVLVRPSVLAGDDTPMLSVVEHALAALEPSLGRCDAVVVLQPTTPLRVAEDIDAAVTLLSTSGAESVVSVYQIGDHHPARMYQRVDDRLVPYAPEPSGRLRQTLSVLYHRNGAIYACRREIIEQQHRLIGDDLRPYVMPRERSLNVDDEHDLLLADLLLRHLRSTLEGAGAAHAHS